MEPAPPTSAVLAAVLLGSELGDVAAALVTITQQVIVIRVRDHTCVPFGAIVTIHFPIEPDDDLVVRCRVIERFNGGLVLHVLEYDTNLPLTLPGSRVLH